MKVHRLTVGCKFIAIQSAIRLRRELKRLLSVATEASVAATSIIPMPGGPINFVIAVSMDAKGRPLAALLKASPIVADC